LDEYEVEVELPDCDSTSTEVRFIRSDADWEDINNPAYRVFCVEPGDYRALGVIKLTVSGEATLPRVIRYFDPDDPTDATHPVHMDTQMQAILQRLKLSNVDYWIVDGLSVLNNDEDTSFLNVTMQLWSSSENIFQRLLVEGGMDIIEIIKLSHNNLIQRSVVRNTIIGPAGSEGECLNITAAGDANLVISGNHIVSNEMYDCTTAIMVHINDHSLGTTFPGTVIANNDLYLTTARYTDCYGTMDPSGDCSAAESGLDFKGGGTSGDPEGRITVTRNRFWGWRKSDTTNLGASGSWGHALSADYYPVNYLLVKDNIITNTARGLVTTDAAHTTVIDNVITSIYSPYDGQGYLIYDRSEGAEFYRNVFVDAVSTGIFIGTNTDFRCNTVINMAKSADVEAVDLQGDFNAFYGKTSPELMGQSGLVFEGIEEAQNEPFCFERRIITGPETHCLEGVQPTLNSPHLDHCDPNLGSRPGVGINDELISN
jgi:hypothetical protein